MLEAHNMQNSVCIRCNYSHTHYYNYQYYNRSSHRLTCSCGHISGNNKAHYISYEDANDGDNIGYCLGCFAILDLRYDMALVSPLSMVNIQISVNGSYILPSGIIVLVDEDIDAYFNDTLVFYQNGTIIS